MAGKLSAFDWIVGSVGLIAFLWIGFELLDLLLFVISGL